MRVRSIRRGGRWAVAVLIAVASVSFGAAYAGTPRPDPAPVWVERATDPAPEATPTPEVPTFVVPDHPEQWFAPGGRNRGTEGIVTFLAALALHDNAPLYQSAGWGRTAGSGRSDHHVGRTDSWACDLAVAGVSSPTTATRTAAARIASALGEPGWAGGTLTKHIAGYRIQVLWLVAGHFDHVHVGVRAVDR